MPLSGSKGNGTSDLDGEMNKAIPFRRELNAEDLIRMRIPKRFWTVKFSSVSELEVNGISAKLVAQRYLENITDMFQRGIGLFLWGSNGTGKTSLSVLIAKEYRRRGYTVLFMEAADLKRLVIDKEYFDEDETIWDRAMHVDVLVIDDFGKGIGDSTGFGARLWDELIRARNSRQLVTFITTNAHPDDLCEKLDVLVSTKASLQEHTIPLQVKGPDLRANSNEQAKEILLQS